MRYLTVFVCLLTAVPCYAKGGAHSSIRIAVNHTSKTGKETTSYKQVPVKILSDKPANQHFGFYKGKEKARYKLWHMEAYKGLQSNVKE